MSHEIDMSNSRANMAFVGRRPWHGLGNLLTAGSGIDVWKEEAGMGWSAMGSGVRFDGLDGSLSPFEGKQVLFRSDTGMPLSVVSNDYQIVQPWEVLEFYRDLLEELGGDYQLETAGCLRDGKTVWALAKSKDKLTLGKKDVVERYLLLSTSFDGTMATQVRNTTVRVVCANTLHMAMNGKADLSVSHAGKFDHKAAKIELGLQSSWRVFISNAELLAATKVSQPQIDEYFLDLFYPKDSEGVRQEVKSGKSKNRLANIQSIFRDAPGQGMVSAKGTAWGLVNAVTSYIDHSARAKTPDLKLYKAWFGHGSVVKARGVELALALTK